MAKISLRVGLASLLAACGMLMGLALAAAAPKGTNVSLDSREFEPYSIDEKLDVKDKSPAFYRQGEAAIDIDEDGDPNLNMRF